MEFGSIKYFPQIHTNPNSAVLSGFVVAAEFIIFLIHLI